MKAMLLCAYRELADGEEILGQGQLDRKISELRALGAGEIIVVLGGPRSDEYLRESRKIHDCELVFDTNKYSLMSNIRAGLAAAEGSSVFVMPIEVETPETSVWKMLVNEGHKAQYSDETHILQPIDATGAPWQSGFPLFITRSGGKFIKHTRDLTGLLDARLRYLHQVYQQESALALDEQGL